MSIGYEYLMMKVVTKTFVDTFSFVKLFVLAYNNIIYIIE